MIRNKLLVLSVMIALLYACNQDGVKKIALITGGHSYDSVNFVEVFQSFEDVVYDHLVHPVANGKMCVCE